MVPALEMRYAPVLGALMGALMSTAVNGQAPAVLVDQTDSPSFAYIVSQDFQSSNQDDCQGADDFTVPAPGWQVGSVDVIGDYHDAGPAASFNVVFYADWGGLPGPAVASRLGQFYTGVGGNVSIHLSPPVGLEAGSYWVSIQARQGFDPAVRWFWGTRLGSAGHPAAWRNPGGGFGTSCASWGVRIECLGTFSGNDYDQLFRLNGKAGVRILLIYGGNEPIALRDALQALPGVREVVLFDGSAASLPFGIANLYGLVVVSSAAPFDDPISLGDHLADYVDSGGRVVQLGFAHSGPGDGRGVNGRWVADSYNPYAYSDELIPSGGAFALGAVDRQDGLMAGVAVLAGEAQNVVHPLPGTQQLAVASNGFSLVARRERPGNFTLGVTAYLGPDVTWNGDFARLLFNAWNVLRFDGFESGTTEAWSTSPQ